MMYKYILKYATIYRQQTMPNLYVEQQGMVAGSELGGSNADTTTDVGFLQNLLSQRGEAVDFSLPRKHRLKTPLFKWDKEKNI